jgi:hypothetical protein
MQQIAKILKSHVNIIDIRRLDIAKNNLQMTYYIDCDDEERLVKIMEELRRQIPEANITFVDQNREILS